MTCVGVRDPVGEQAVAVRRAANRTIVNQEGSETHRGGGTAKERRVRERRDRHRGRRGDRGTHRATEGGRWGGAEWGETRGEVETVTEAETDGDRDSYSEERH